MKIKKLTIHGFKSFVDKVTLSFPMGASAIIGPNGCGKSNIVDAIRWVLGEQNARHLRGKLMEDIIFNGSESRKPLGMAEVSLVFSNEEGLAAARFANFTEIEISRRLYRSGESEYYINRVQSRLRDIIDLFTDTGIGTRAYSIIEQGQVGWLINAKPEERRAIFEEAAGINKFKHKKEAALRRLEATRDNLTRVNDIISEVKRQLNSLNRQAKKAERYKALREELRGVELLLSSLELKKMKDALEGVFKRLESIKDSELGVSAEIASKESAVEETKAEYDAAEAAYRAVRERIVDLERNIQTEERAGALAAMRIDELRRAEERLSSEIGELTGSKETATVEIERLKETLSLLASVIDGETGKLLENSSLLDAVVSDLKSREDSQRSINAESLKLSARLTDIRHTMQTLLKDEEFFLVKEAKAKSAKEELSRQLQSLEEPLRNLRETLRDAVARREAKDAELKNLRERLEALDKEREAKGAEIKELKDEYSKASARLAALDEMEKNFESLKGGAKSIMLKPDKNGVYGIIADVIEANPGYEKAVEAVLGERLQYVLVESHRQGVEAIEYLKTSSSGRGSFVPVRDTRPNPVTVQAGGEYYTGAKELLSEIRIKDGYQAIMNYLLGDTLVVENLSAALDLWRQNGFYKTFVTFDGDILDSQGIITGGSSNGADPGSGILQRRGEIKRLKSSAFGLEGRIGALEERSMELDGEIISAKTLLDECRENLHAMDIESVNMEGALKRNEEESVRLNGLIDAADTDIEDAIARLTEISGKKVSMTSERETLESELVRKEALSNALVDEIKVLAGKKEVLNGVVTEIKVALAQAKERMEALTRQVSEKEGFIEDTLKRIEARKSEIEKGSVEASGKNAQVEEIKARLEGLISGLDMVKKEDAANTDLLTDISSRIKEAEAQIKELKSRLSELQENKGSLTIELKEMELAIANLKEKMTDRYGVAIENFAPSEEELSQDLDCLEARREEMREKIADLGEVSLSALEEYAELERRHQFLLDQQADLTKSVDTLHAAIARINRTTREKFKAAFDEINEKFKETFPRFFNGGRAEVRLADEGDVLEAGVEIVAQPPGKRLQNITLLSGGEKALTATALIFAIFLIKPSPFCLLDEVDAPLDDANIDRFNLFVRDMSKLSQFMLITHNKKTMEMADALYGVTMQEPGISKILTVKL